MKHDALGPVPAAEDAGAEAGDMIPEEDEIAADTERDPHFAKLTLQDEGGTSVSCRDRMVSRKNLSRSCIRSFWKSVRHRCWIFSR